jgi:hypothetical protein
MTEISVEVFGCLLAKPWRTSALISAWLINKDLSAVATNNTSPMEAKSVKICHRNASKKESDNGSRR